MARPRLLDLFCGQGGAAQGYYLAGFDVVGLDAVAQPRYPFEFHQGDALDLADWPPGRFDAIHASPVCKGYSKSSASWRKAGREYPNQIPATRRALRLAGVPWVIENVPGAPLRPDFQLCGCLFGLAIAEGYLVRERWFETSWRGFDLRAPCYHSGTGAISIAGHGVATWSRATVGPVKLAERRRLMGCEWMDRNGLGEAIPPAYTEYLGARLLEQVEVAA
jgi:DNA (cytosine-5)-methyltransferase 1